MLKTQIRRALSHYGYVIERKPLDRFFILLKELNFTPRHIIDVGANHGGWTRRALRYFPDCRFTLVEPNPDLKAHVQDLTGSGNVRWVNAGVSDRRGVLPFTLWDKDHSSTFMLTRAEAQDRGFRQIEVETLTLNDILARTGQPAPDLVKIDAEGFDLKAVRGASELMGKTDVFLMEAAVNCPLFADSRIESCVSVMRESGYVMFDMTDVVRSPKHRSFWSCELAFVRRDSPIRRASEEWE